MDILLGLVCGLALFLYGMGVMGDALKKSAGRKLKVILGKLTSNKLKGFLLGLGVTAVIQSSSATTVMVVGFVTSGTMTLGQAVGVIFGANVGTAVTAWLTALNSLSGASSKLEFLNVLKPDTWMPILAFFGIALIMFSKKRKLQDVGTILMGFAVLMVGMDLMSGAVKPLAGEQWFKDLLVMFENPILGVLAGTVLTAVVQSSSASVGILQAIAVGTGTVSFAAAMPIIMGQNIGTCVTAIISSVSANKNGKRAAFVHLYFNVIGVILWLGLYYLVGFILSATNVFELFSLADSNMINAFGIAGIHTVFKLFSVLVLFPFTKYLEKLAVATVRGEDKKGDEFTNMLDDRLMETPTVAIERSREVSCRMADIAIGGLEKSIDMLTAYDSKQAQVIRDLEDKADIYEDVLGSYLVKLSSKDMSEIDSHEATKLLHMIGDLERISDHSVNLVDSAEEIRDKNISFSEQAMAELDVLYKAIKEILSLTADAFAKNNLESAYMVEPLEQVVDDHKEQIKHNHTIRLQKSQCSIELGFILSDILTNLERVADHCSNVAGCLIEMSKHESLDLHNYLQNVKESDKQYALYYEAYAHKYAIQVAK